MDRPELLRPPMPRAREHFAWATVVSAAPLAVQIDGHPEPLAVTPLSLVADLEPDDRVLVQFVRGGLVVVGRLGGSAALYGWERVVPSGVSSTGATATVDASGVVTCPAGTTAVGIDGILDPDYETEVVFRGRTIAGASTGYSMRMRATSGGVPDTSADYHAAGAYSQNTGTQGWYGASGATSAPVGAISTGAAPGAGFNTTIRLRQAWVLQRWTYGFNAWNHFAIGSRAEGFTPSPSGQYDGLRFFPDGTGTPSFQGEFTVYRRRIS